MRLTRQGDYAVRVMVDLAAQAPGVAVRHAHIQARQDVPAAYLAKIIQALARAGLVRTRPGAHGGVTLDAPAEAVTLLRVIEAVEGPIRLNRCVEAPSACPRDRFCRRSPWWWSSRSPASRRVLVAANFMHLRFEPALIYALVLIPLLFLVVLAAALLPDFVWHSVSR